VYQTAKYTDKISSDTTLSNDPPTRSISQDLSLLSARRTLLFFYSLSGICTHSSLLARSSLLAFGGSELAASRVQQSSVTPLGSPRPEKSVNADFLLPYRDFTRYRDLALSRLRHSRLPTLGSLTPESRDAEMPIFSCRDLAISRLAT
jgi:hypothetical protein